MGRKKKNAIALKESHSYRTVNSSVSARNLRKSDLCGVIFGCTHKTIKECFAKNLFGLPDGHFSYVSKIEPGLPLFLFSYSDRKLHGVFEAASKGRMHIDPYGWSESSTETTPFGAQVRVRIKHHCQPLVEEVYKPRIADNYFEEGHFWNELDRDQTDGLIQLFLSSLATGYSSCPRTLRPAMPSQLNMDRKGSSSAALTAPVVHAAISIPQMKWSSLFKASPAHEMNNANVDVEDANLEQEGYPEEDRTHWRSSSEEDSPRRPPSPAPVYPEEDSTHGRSSSEKDSPRRAPSPAPVPVPVPAPCMPSAGFNSPPQSGFFSTIPPPHMDSTPPMMHMYKAFSQSTYEVHQAMDFLIVALLRQDDYLTQLCQNVISLRDEFRASKGAATASEGEDESDE